MFPSHAGGAESSDRGGNRDLLEPPATGTDRRPPRGLGFGRAVPASEGEVPAGRRGEVGSHDCLVRVLIWNHDGLVVAFGTERHPCQSGLTRLLKTRSLKVRQWEHLSVKHLREGAAAAGKGCALRCYRRSSADAISCTVTCWISPTPTLLFQ